MIENTIAGIRADRDHDKAMIDGVRDEIQQLRMKIEYYNGKIDAANKILNEIAKNEVKT